MSESSNNLTIFIILAVFAGLAGLICFAYNNWSKRQTEGKHVIAEIIAPYFDLLEKQKYESAYSMFFSSDFKRKHSLNDFVKAHQEHQSRFGNLLRWENRSIEWISEIGRAKYLRLMYALYCDKEKNIIVMYEIIKENDRYVINETYYKRVNTLIHEIW